MLTHWKLDFEDDFRALENATQIELCTYSVTNKQYQLDLQVAAKLQTSRDIC